MLANYTQFNGQHWETGTIRNALDYQGVKAPHTGEAPTEALLMGVSGGIVFGYFSFAYEGYDPHVAILTRNTFDPWNTMLERLGIVQNVLHTHSADKAVQNLEETIEQGTVPIVWADMFTMPYNALDANDEGWWAMMPVIVYEHGADGVKIADRSQVALTVTPEILARARVRVKKDKHRIITLEHPNWDKLNSAVQKGIWDTIKLFTDKPPKAAKQNFGFDGMEHWAKLLTKPKQRMSWAKEFPVGRKWLAGLTSAYDRVQLGVAHNPAERHRYAAFLDEAAAILDKPDLKVVADQFRASAEVWQAVACSVLPDEYPLLKELRELLDKERRLFYEQGGAALAEIQATKARIEAIKQAAETDFPFSDVEVAQVQAGIAEAILKVKEVEQAAVVALQQAMG